MAKKSEFLDTFIRGKINMTFSRNRLLSAGLIFLCKNKTFFFRKDHNCSKSYCIFKDEFLKKCTAIESFSTQPVTQSVK